MAFYFVCLKSITVKLKHGYTQCVTLAFLEARNKLHTVNTNIKKFLVLAYLIRVTKYELLITIHSSVTYALYHGQMRKAIIPRNFIVKVMWRYCNIWGLHTGTVEESSRLGWLLCWLVTIYQLTWSTFQKTSIFYDGNLQHQHLPGQQAYSYAEITILKSFQFPQQGKQSFYYKR